MQRISWFILFFWCRKSRGNKYTSSSQDYHKPSPKPFRRLHLHWYQTLLMSQSRWIRRCQQNSFPVPMSPAYSICLLCYLWCSKRNFLASIILDSYWQVFPVYRKNLCLKCQKVQRGKPYFYDFLWKTVKYPGHVCH